METLLYTLKNGLAFQAITDVEACELFSTIKRAYLNKPSLNNAYLFLDAVRTAWEYPKRRMLYRQVYKNRVLYARLFCIANLFRA